MLLVVVYTWYCFCRWCMSNICCCSNSWCYTKLCNTNTMTTTMTMTMTTTETTTETTITKKSISMTATTATIQINKNLFKNKRIILISKRNKGELLSCLFLRNFIIQSMHLYDCTMAVAHDEVPQFIMSLM